jgi:eukaryotic-like serine/threonine-protein kinase
MTVDARSNTVRFGPFEFDRRTDELRRKGARIRLQGQPIQILTLLLDRPGELVTQDEIRKKLWPDGTIVEYENGIKTALGKLRYALGDDSETPQYVETLPRRGYRFIAPVENITLAELAGVDRTAPLDAKSDKKTNVWPWVALGVATLAGLSMGGYRFFHRAPTLTDTDTILVSDFVNATGDSVFDGTLREGLTVQLEQSPFLSVISEARIQQTLPLMGQPPDAQLSPKIARDLCRRVGSVATINGSIASLGSQFVVDLKAIECSTGNSLAEDQETADSNEQVLKALGRATTKLRNKLGESLSTVHRFDTAIEEATTPSLDALQAYSLGMKLLVGKSDFDGALPLFQHAIDLDPNFAAAYSGLVLTYINLGETDLASKAAQKAYELRSGVSEPEKFLIETNYYQFVSGDLERARQICEVWSQTYPRDHLPRGFGIAIYSALSQYERALEEARANLLLDPTSALAYGGLVMSYIPLGRLREAKATGSAALAKNLDSPFLREELYQVAFLENNAPDMEQQLVWAAGKPGVEDLMLAMHSHTAAYSGRVSNASDFLRRAVDSAERAEEKETAALYEADAGEWEALFGLSAQCREHGRAALSRSRGRDVEFAATLGLALGDQTGRDQSEIKRLADDLAKRFSEDTVVKFNYLPSLRAQIALNGGHSSQAIEILEASLPYELGTPAGYGFFQALSPVYVRGTAYLAAGRGEDAAVEFQKIIMNRSIVQNAPIGALAHLGLARAYAVQAEATSDNNRPALRAKARSAYRDFFDLWKEADANIPVLMRARAEFARLQ